MERRARRGFSLIEVIIAMAILLIIIVSVLMLATVTASSLKDSEAREMAKNIATYTVEYLRARNVTYPDNPLGHALSEFAHYDNSTPPNYVNADFPGLVDLWDSPPLNPSPLKPNSASGTETINIHPALPNQTYDGHFDTSGNLITGGGEPKAFYYSLQGFVSLADNPAGSDPSSEDANAKAVSGKYYDLVTGAPYVVRFPFKSSDPNAIENFSAGPTYIPMIYTTDPNKINSAKPEYDPHYTNIASDKSKTMDYNGFRVLTSISARVKEDPGNPGHPLVNHVQYYDVKVTVLWILGSKEHSYSLSTQVTAYGGS